MAAFSFGRLLKRGCLNTAISAVLLPRCPVSHGKLQLLGGKEQQLPWSSMAVSR